MKPRIEVKQVGGYWSLIVNGIPTVQRESFAVCDRIRDELERPGCYWPSEASEVADSIRRYLRSHARTKVAQPKRGFPAPSCGN